MYFEISNNYAKVAYFDDMKSISKPFYLPNQIQKTKTSIVASRQHYRYDGEI